MIKNDPKQNFGHNTSPANPKYEPRGLMTENNNVYKTIRNKTYCFLS